MKKDELLKELKISIEDLNSHLVTFGIGTNSDVIDDSIANQLRTRYGINPIVELKPIVRPTGRLKDPIKATCPECSKSDLLICQSCGFCAKCADHSHCTDLTEKEKADLQAAQLNAVAGMMGRR